jgi:hypothetical protein
MKNNETFAEKSARIAGHNKCKWYWYPLDRYYRSSCCNNYTFHWMERLSDIDGFRFCPFCGKEIKT